MKKRHVIALLAGVSAVASLSYFLPQRKCGKAAADRTRLGRDKGAEG